MSDWLGSDGEELLLLGGGGLTAETEVEITDWWLEWGADPSLGEGPEPETEGGATTTDWQEVEEEWEEMIKEDEIKKDEKMVM